ncbi:hypothetical protein BDR22DRAFT_865060 [Usnea florida]
MLGLRPRLKARNSLWDLVNKHSLDLHSSSSISLKQPVEEGADGLPPIHFLSSSFSPEGNPHHNHPFKSSASFIMAPSKKDSKRSREETGEEQYGSIFSVSGYGIHEMQHESVF